MKQYLAITQALADCSRSRILLFLGHGELCVCQIIEMLGLAPSTVSKHLTVLQQAGLVESRKEGRWIYYRLPDRPDARIRGALLWMRRSLATDPRIRADAARLDAVLKLSRDELCVRYKSGCVSPAKTRAGAGIRKYEKTRNGSR